MKSRISALLCLLLSSVAAWAVSDRYEVDVQDFQELKVTDGINVTYRYVPDSVGKAVFNTTPQLAQEILFVPSPGKLEIQLATKKGRYEGLPTVTVYSRFISKVENDGDSTVRVLAPQPNSKIKLRLVGNGRLIAEKVSTSLLEGSIDTGNGTLVVSGNASASKLTSTGSGKILADNLIVETSSCKIIGTGSITCDVKQELTIGGMGTGTIYYRGNPRLKKKMAINVKCVPLTE